MNKRAFLYKSALVASLSGFLFGFDTVVISGAEQTIQSLWRLSGSLHGLAVSMALWGTVIGALSGGWPAETFGRRKTLFWIGILYFVSAAGSALAPEVWSFMAFRFIGGLGVGISTVAAPLFISEIAPPAYRGRLTGMFQFNIVFGILVAFLSNSLLSGLEEHAWRWMLGVEAAPALLFTLLCFGLPKSPRWLIVHCGNREAGIGVLKRINPDLSGAEVNRLTDEIAMTAQDTGKSNAFFTRKMRRSILLAISIALFNQLSGINAILYFAPRIFGMVGLEAQAALLQSVGIGVTNLLFTLAGLWLIDRFGRRSLLLTGSAGYIVSLGLIVWAFTSGNVLGVPVFIFMFIAAHAIGQGAVIWVFIGEIFPNRQRAWGQALGSFTHWFMAAALTLVFPVVAEQVAPRYIFGFFCGMMVIQLIWVMAVVPETKGVSLEAVDTAVSGKKGG